MLEPVELYGVTWKTNGVTSTTEWEDRDVPMRAAIVGMGQECQLIIGPQFPMGELLTKISCPTLDRAAMIVALLARPDAQFELMEWRDMSSSQSTKGGRIFHPAFGQPRLWAPAPQGPAKMDKDGDDA